MEQGDFLSFVSYGAGDRLTSLTQFLVLNGKLYMCSAHQRADGASGQCQITVWPTSSQEKGENLILIYQARADVSCRGTRRINQCDSLPSRPLSLSPSLDYKADCGAKEYFARVTLIAPPPARALYIMCPPPPLPSPPPPAGHCSLAGGHWPLALDTAFRRLGRHICWAGQHSPNRVFHSCYCRYPTDRPVRITDSLCLNIVSRVVQNTRCWAARYRTHSRSGRTIKQVM